MKNSALKTIRPGGFFITGTDTDVGKTYATACIGLSLLEQNFMISPRKPIASGCIVQHDGSLLSEDALFVKQALGAVETLSTICPFTFKPPISPQRALKQAGVTLNILDLVKACNKPSENVALVEGAGGFYSPLCSDGLNQHLAQALNYPVILVIGNRLGCINSALLSIEAIKQSGLKLHCLIINDISPTSDIENVHDITAFVAKQSMAVYHLKYSKNYTAHIIPGFKA